MGTVSVVMFVLIVVMNYTTVLRQTLLINDEVVTCDAIVTSEIRIVTGVIYFLTIFFVEIPMCMLTFFNIRKNMMDNSYSGIFRLVVLVHYIIDALFAFKTVSPLKEKLKYVCCGWKLRGRPSEDSVEH